MATASWRARIRSARNSNRNRGDSEEDNVHLNAKKDSSQNAYEILHNLCQKQDISDAKRIAYLNLLIKLFEDVAKSHHPLAISKKDIICCLRVCLVSANTTVRAATFRVLRHIITEPGDIAILNRFQIPYLIARSIDVVLKNDNERMQAVKLSLKILYLAPNLFSHAVARSLVSLVNGTNDTKDRLFCPGLSLLCNLSVLHPDLAIETTADASLLRNSVDGALGKINECLVGCIVFLLNRPATRNKTHLSLNFLTSGYCDLQRKSGETNQLAGSRCSVMAAFRTWAGVAYLCNPANPSGITAIINMLYLNEPEVWRSVLELLYEVFGLALDESCADPDEVFASIDPSRPQDGWRLIEGFVVAEGKHLLAGFINTRPNLSEVQTCLILYCFLECGLVAALVEVIVGSNLILSAQALTLLGVVLHMTHKLLPCELYDLSPSLPTLLKYATDGTPQQKTRAVAAVTSLNTIHRILIRPPVPTSLFLRHIVSQGNRKKKKSIIGGHKVDDLFGKSSRKNRFSVKHVDHHLRESELLSERDPRDWNWAYISIILKCRSESTPSMEQAQYKVLLRKLLHFYKPSSGQFAAIEYSLKDSRNEKYTTTAIHFLDLLLESPQKEDCSKLLDELLTDMCREFGNLVSSSNAYDCVLSPSKMQNTLSQHYFLLIGHLTTSERGLNALNRVRALEMFMNIVDNTRHDVYIKLIVSSLCYSYSSSTRKILAKALTCSMDSVRTYSTELLLVLARCGVPQFHKWGLELLIPQIYDENKLVASASVDILHELCYDRTYLDCLIDTRPSLLQLGDKGHLLLIRFLSTPTGFNYLNESNFVEKELEKWEKGYNYRFVNLVEGELHDSLTMHQRGEDGRYSKRLTNARHRWKPVWLPPHLYGELACHAAGFSILENNLCIQRMIQRVSSGHCESDMEILGLKASLWALSNMCTSPLAFQFLEDKQIVQSIVSLAQNCLILSVRATAFYCLSLIATTEFGASCLTQLNWFTVRHSRSDLWPVEVFERPRDSYRHTSEEDLSSTAAIDAGDSESVEDLSPFLEYPPANSPFPLSQRASTLPPGLSGDMSQVDDLSSPTSTVKKRHQRSYSETCSLLVKEPTFEPTTPQRMSLEDAAGLATLQSLHASRRPTISSIQPFGDVEPRHHFRSEHRSSSPMTEFEAENPPRLFSDGSSASLAGSDVVDGVAASSAETGPIYRGICLPKALSQFLTIVERREERRRRRASPSFSEMEQVKEMEEEKAQSSSTSDDSEIEDIVEGRSKRSRHNASQCVVCCTKIPKSKRKRKISSSSYRLRTDTESSYGNAGEGSPVSLMWRLKATSEGGSCESFSCGEGDAELVYAPQPVLSQTRVRRDILRHVTRMCNPVWAKNSQLALFRLKQSHQNVFEDACLYSSACAILSNSACQLSSRRIVQELFWEVTFSQFYDDAAITLAPFEPQLNLQQEPAALKNQATTESSVKKVPPFSESSTKNTSKKSTVLEDSQTSSQISYQASSQANYENELPKT